MKGWNFTYRAWPRCRGPGVMTAIAAVMIAAVLIQDQAPPPQMPDLSQMIFSPWVRFCLQGEDGNQVCFTPGDRRSETSPKTYDGPPVDPEVFKAQQLKLQAELQRRAEAARKKLEEHVKKLRDEEPK
jgi:hypothetical protein